MATRYDPNRHRRRSVRLPGFDYPQTAAYFITLCAHLQECLFGAVVDEQVLLTEFGQVVEEEWRRTAVLRPYVRLDSHVVMPNHFHGVIWLEHDRGGTMHRAPTEERFGKPVAGSPPTIVRAFKAAATRRINRMRDTPGAGLAAELLRASHPHRAGAERHPAVYHRQPGAVDTGPLPSRSGRGG